MTREIMAGDNLCVGDEVKRESVAVVEVEEVVGGRACLCVCVRKGEAQKDHQWGNTLYNLCTLCI